jgi:Ca2+-binding RTX toxin-like protein
MDTRTTTTAGRRALALSALTGALFLALLGFGADRASAAYTAVVNGGTLELTGDGASDSLLLAADSTTLVVDVGSDGTADFSFDRSTFTAILVEAGRGDDVVRTVGNLIDETLTVDGGPGDDQLFGGNGPDQLIGGAGNDFVDGNLGTDLAQLGSGNDRFQWDPGDSSDTVEGQGGTDTLDFNGSNIAELMEASANGPRVRFTRNIASIVMDLDDVEAASVRTLGGADIVTVNDLAGTDLRTVDVDLTATLGGGDSEIDTVVARATDGPDSVSLGSSAGKPAVLGLFAVTRITAAEAADTLSAATLGGADTVTTGVGLVPGPGSVSADGGDDADTLRYNGTGGADVIQVVANGTAAAVAGDSTALVSGLVESLVVSGLGGNDTIVGTGNLAALTSITMDGGAGDDDLRGGNGADLLLGGTGNDHVDGNQGTDTAQLGSGNDRFQWDPGDSSDTVEGQGGTDTLDFNGSNIGEILEASANGPRVRFTRNIATVTTDLNDVEAINLRTFGGADVVTVGDLSGTDVRTVDVDLSSSLGGGDGSADSIVVNGSERRDVVNVTASGAQVLASGLFAQTRIVGSEPASDTLEVRTLGGNDDVTVAPTVADLIAAIVDLGGDE